jgi:hypothetical protein
LSTATLAVLVALLAVSFWRPLRRLRGALGGHLVASGHAFLVLGVAVGIAFGLPREAAFVDNLGPIVALAAGWVGFAAGTRFEGQVLRTVPVHAYARALAPALAAAAAVGAAGVAVLAYAGAPTAQVAGGALCLAAAAASAGPTLAAVLRTRRARRSRDAAAMLRMVEFSAGIADGLVVVLALAAFALVRPYAEPIAPASILALSVGGGAALGIAAWLFLGGDAIDDERLLLGLGALALIAGLGGYLEVSPAAVGAVAGVVLANLPGGRADVLVGAVRRVERPVVVILMAVIGMHIAGGVTRHVVPLVVAMTGLRLGAKALAGGRARDALDGAPSLATPAQWTLGLAPQGILGLVVALSFFHVWRDDLALAVLAAVALGGLINELLGPMLLLRVLRRLSTEEGRAL